MATIQNIPQLRFPGFEGEWEIDKLQSRIKTIDSGWSPQCEEFPSTENEWGVLKTTSVVWEGFNESANKKLPEKFSPRPELKVSVNDILITRAGPTSRVGVTVHINRVRDKLMLSDKLIRIRSKDKCSSLFLAISLSNNSAQKQLVSKSSGLAESQTNISQKILLNIKLSFPTLPEQQKIASFLSAVDEKIQQLSRKKQLLEQYKKGVMQQLFSGKLRFKDENGKDYPDWEEKKLGEVAKFRRGSFPQPYGLPKWYDDENGMPFIQVYDVDSNMLLKNTTKNKISKLGAEQSVFVKKGTLVITIQGSIGRIAKTQYDAYVDRTLLIFQSYKLPTDVDYFKYVVFLLFEIEKTKAPGGTIKTITKEVLTDFTIPIPCIQEQQKIANFLSNIDIKIENTNQEINKMQNFKKGLLQKMFV